MIRDAATLKRYFETNDKPTQQQFADLIDTLEYVKQLALRATMGQGPLIRSNNLSDLTDKPVARTNLSVYSKNELDLLIQQRPFKAPVKCATVANAVLDGGVGNQIDGVVIAAGDRVLVRAQTVGAQNGIYTVVAGAPWMRATDADSAEEVFSGISVFVEKGTTNGNKVFALVTDNPITLGVTAQVWERISGAVSSVNSMTGDVALITDDIPEGADNKWIDNVAGVAPVNRAIALSTDNIAAGANAARQYSKIDTVNGVAPVARAITLTTDDIAAGATNKYFTAQVYEGADDAPGVLIPANPALPAIYNGTTNGTFYKWTPGSPNGAWSDMRATAAWRDALHKSLTDELEWVTVRDDFTGGYMVSSGAGGGHGEIGWYSYATTTRPSTDVSFPDRTGILLHRGDTAADHILNWPVNNSEGYPSMFRAWAFPPWQAIFIFRLCHITNVAFNVGLLNSYGMPDNTTFLPGGPLCGGIVANYNAALGANWRFYLTDGARSNVQNSTINARTNAYHKLVITCTTANSVSFSMDGETPITLTDVLLSTTMNTTARTTGTVPGFHIRPSEAVMKVMFIDFFSFRRKRTR